MAFEIPKQPYSGKIGTSTVGSGSAAVTVGGSDSYAFHLFEGSSPNPPKIAMEIWDYDPSPEWPQAAIEPFKDVISSPSEWAKKCVEEYGADLIVLQLKGTDPNGMDKSADETAKTAKEVADAVDVPLVVWGTANNQKDEDVLKKISELCEGMNVGLGPVEEANHKGVGASALGYGQLIVASSPIDVNLAKQLNILLGNLGVKQEKIIIDPTTGGLGYGMEYSYSVMERIRMAALTQEDEKLQVPLINNIGNEVWKCKEAGQSEQDAPTLGDAEKRPILMEAAAAAAYLLAGSDIVILRHPETVRLTRSFIELMINGGMATGIAEISKNLEKVDVDLLAVSPEPVLEFEEAKKEVKAVKKAAPKAEKKEVKAEPKKEPEKEVKPEPELKAEEAKPKAEVEADKKAAEEAKAKAKAEAEKKAEQEARVKAEVEAEKKAAEEAKAEAKAEAEKKAAEEAKAESKSKELEELQALRLKRSIEREKLEAERGAAGKFEIKKTPAGVQPGLVERLTQDLDRIHKRA